MTQVAHSPRETVIVERERFVIVAGARQGPPGVNGNGSGGATAYTHAQPSPSSTWVINHNLGLKPVTAVYSVGGMEITAEVLHVSNNQLQILFASPTAGFARLI